MKDVTEEDQQELAALNGAVSDTLAARQAWLDARMAEYADVPVGGRLFDLATGQCAGIVTRHLRFFRDRDGGVNDDKLDIQYEYRTNGGHLQNTLAQIERVFGGEGQVVTVPEVTTGSTVALGNEDVGVKK